MIPHVLLDARTRTCSCQLHHNMAWQGLDFNRLPTWIQEEVKRRDTGSHPGRCVWQVIRDRETIWYSRPRLIDNLAIKPKVTQTASWQKWQLMFMYRYIKLPKKRTKTYYRHNKERMDKPPWNGQRQVSLGVLKVFWFPTANDKEHDDPELFK